MHGKAFAVRTAFFLAYQKSQFVKKANFKSGHRECSVGLCNLRDLAFRLIP
jgi:hypothetical protein